MQWSELSNEKGTVSVWIRYCLLYKHILEDPLKLRYIESTISRSNLINLDDGNKLWISKSTLFNFAYTIWEFEANNGKCRIADILWKKIEIIKKDKTDSEIKKVLWSEIVWMIFFCSSNVEYLMEYSVEWSILSKLKERK